MRLIDVDKIDAYTDIEDCLNPIIETIDKVKKGKRE